MKAKTEKFLKPINFLLTLSVLYFAYQYVDKLMQEARIGNVFSSLNFWLLSVSLLLFLLFYIILSVHWLRICRLFDKDANSKQILAFFASQPYKYLPTSLFTFSFRAKYAKKAGLGLKNSSLAQLVENINIVSSGLLVAVFFYLASINYIWAALTLLTFLSIYAVFPKNLNVRFKKISKSFDKKEAAINIIVVSAAWIVAGLAFLSANRAVRDNIDFFTAIAANAAAYVAGILVVFAPGGLGVREIVFTSFLIAGPTIIVWRLLTFVADMIFGFGAIGLLKNRKN